MNDKTVEQNKIMHNKSTETKEFETASLTAVITRTKPPRIHDAQRLPIKTKQDVQSAELADSQAKDTVESTKTVIEGPQLRPLKNQI